METGTLDALLTLSLTPGLGPTLTRRCLEAFGSPEAVIAARSSALGQVEGIGPQRAQAIGQALGQLRDGQALAREKQLIEAHGVTILAFDEPDYPALLRHIPDPPPVLYVRGNLEPGDALALGVVGARKCTNYGREQADRLASLCAQAGLCIISGGAYGIDAAAHRAALRAGGRTVAVLGSGLAEPYPADHIPLFDQIVNEGQGAVVSEMPMSAPPVPENFPRRNRIISGLSLGVLVVEASLRSGALITARLAAEEHHREVMAVPGRVDSPASAGCHKILREGWATLVTSAADVLDALGDAGTTLKAGLMAEPDHQDSPTASNLFLQNLTDAQRKIIEALTEPRAVDQLTAITGLPVQTIQADLTMLQIRGLISRENGLIARSAESIMMGAPGALP